MAERQRTAFYLPMRGIGQPFFYTWFFDLATSNQQIAPKYYDSTTG
jgi:hypothetical protein